MEDKTIMGQPLHIDRSVNKETYVLGAILKFGNTELEKTMEFIKSEDEMTEFKHRIIYKNVLEVYKNGKSCTYMSLRENVSDKALKDMGGSLYLMELIDDVATSVFVSDYAKDISETYRHKKATQIYLNAAGALEQDDADVDQIIAMTEDRVYEIGGGIAEEGLRPYSEILPIVMNRMQGYQSGEIQKQLIYSGFTGLDNIVGGFLPGQVIVIGGYTSSGKTALALQVAEHIGSIQKKTVGYFSLEMGSDELVERSLIGQSRIGELNYKNSHLSDEHWDSVTRAKNRLALSKVLFSDKPACSILDIKRQAKRAIMQNDLKAFVIDYLSLVPTTRMATREQEISEISQSVKRLARELRVPAFLLVQLSREHQKRADKTPQLFDLRDSGAIEQVSDVVIFTHHDKEKSELIVAKQRNGKCGTIPMTFNNGRWEQLTKRDEPVGVPPIEEPVY